MKRTALFMALCISIPVFGETIAPEAGRVGFTGNITSIGQYNLNTGATYVNPGVGMGFRWHITNFLLTEVLPVLSTDRSHPQGGSEITRYALGGGLGIYYWINLADDFSIFFGPQTTIYVNLESDESRRILIGTSNILFGAQYSFSKHFAVFGTFGAGVYSENNTDTSANTTDFKGYYNVLFPSFGFVFYF
jgi:hypothetical protein